ncbi:hypothetical protein EMIHUDRAFT_363751 [Emiliania huxleyi CCMP1516]|uniref:Uncharacterized protein n=2 Tax=Emiliania huxleyi TaxID=2903 RepID=A0A0D3KDQ0_EMIH1|nr:hypothetical protein EMIHUDRAFT_363751 [Emiliania huxleyi CCMP1516]EOD33885.1 hypothetical protein EMIHUDRAFT_363751 [Emiliania huxleyi CCMP1516]|eukprot:XP_005786314.1 hypothetical protein EMIHUDRAFT_363751 [Emiliania huxleyi CCMP1516]
MRPTPRRGPVALLGSLIVDVEACGGSGGSGGGGLCMDDGGGRSTAGSHAAMARWMVG